MRASLLHIGPHSSVHRQTGKKLTGLTVQALIFSSVKRDLFRISLQSPATQDCPCTQQIKGSLIFLRSYVIRPTFRTHSLLLHIAPLFAKTAFISHRRNQNAQAYDFPVQAPSTQTPSQPKKTGALIIRSKTLTNSPKDAHFLKADYLQPPIQQPPITRTRPKSSSMLALYTTTQHAE